MRLIHLAIQKACLMVTMRRGVYTGETYNSPLALGTLNLLRILHQQVLNVCLKVLIHTDLILIRSHHPPRRVWAIELLLMD
jgi:hypothetical protein